MCLATVTSRLSALEYHLLLVSAMATGRTLASHRPQLYAESPDEKRADTRSLRRPSWTSQSVCIAEESGGDKGYDAGKKVPGRKRHLLVDTSGFLLAERVTPANISDNRGAGTSLRTRSLDAPTEVDLGRQRLLRREAANMVRRANGLASASRSA